MVGARPSFSLSAPSKYGSAVIPSLPSFGSNINSLANDGIFGCRHHQGCKDRLGDGKRNCRHQSKYLKNQANDGNDGMTALPYLLGAVREKEQEDPTRGSPCVYLDFETHSALNLELVGARTRVLLLAYAIGGGRVQVWRPPVNENDPLPADLYRAIADSWRVVAHNYGFDRAIWDEHMLLFGAPDIPIGQWDCTAFRARLARLPSSLEEAARTLRLAAQKDAAGRRLMRSLIRRDL
jgi:hypothetical protein